MSKPPDDKAPITLGSATIGDVEIIEPTPLLLGDVTAVPTESVSPNITAKVAAPAFYAVLTRRDGSVPWQLAIKGEAYDALNVPRTTLGDLLPTLPEDIQEGVLERCKEAEQHLHSMQESFRQRAHVAAITTWNAVNLLAEHHAPPIDDAVAIALENDRDKAEKPQHRELAREAAESTETKDNPRDWIANEVRVHLTALRDKLTPLKLQAIPKRSEDEMMALAAKADAILADYLEGGEPLGEDGETIARTIRESIEDRQKAGTQIDTEGELERGRAWRLWIDMVGSPSRGPFPFLTLLARAVWRDVARPKLEEDRKLTARRAPGLVRSLFVETAGRYRPAPDLFVSPEGFKTTDDDGQFVHLADLPTEVPLKLLEGAPRALATIQTYDTALWAITQGAKETWAKHGSPGRWRFEGGKHVAALIQGLETIEAPDPDARREILPKVAKAYEQAALALLVPFRNPKKPEEVLSLAAGRVRAGRGRRPTIIELDLAGWALPGDVYDRMGGGHNARAREERKIVPLPTGRPKLLEASQGYGRLAGPSAWHFARIVGEIRLRAADVARGTGAHLPRRTLERLAKEAGLDPKWLAELLALWLSGDNADADLEQLGRDRYHVGPAHQAARLAIEREGKKEVDGARGKAPRRKRMKRPKN